MQALYSVLPIFFIIMVGVIIKKILITNEEFWKNCERLIYFFFFPCLLISKLAQVNFDQVEVLYALLALISATLIIIFILIVVHKIFPYKNSLFTSVFQGSIRFNSYIYIAMAFSLYGEVGLNLSIILAGLMILFLNLACVIVLSIYGSHQSSLRSLIKELLQNPLIISVLVGYLIGYFRIPIYSILIDTMNTTALAALPLSLISVGAGLKFSIGQKRWIAILCSTSIKLIMLPIIAFLLLNFFNVTGLTQAVSILFASSACAASSYILARQMGGDAKAMASIITLTTLGSIVTMPIMISLHLS